MGVRIRPTVEKSCLNCGKTFHARIDQLNFGRGRTCSLSCAAALASINRNQRKELNNNWRGGIPKAEKAKEYWRKNPEKRMANIAVRSAIKAGNLIKGLCELCGSAETDGHHDDYSKPLEVRWLCRKHHSEHHKTIRACR